MILNVNFLPYHVFSLIFVNLFNIASTGYGGGKYTNLISPIIYPTFPPVVIWFRSFALISSHTSICPTISFHRFKDSRLLSEKPISLNKSEDRNQIDKGGIYKRARPKNTIEPRKLGETGGFDTLS